MMFVREGCPGRGSRWSDAPEDGPVDKVISERLSSSAPASQSNLICLCPQFKIAALPRALSQSRVSNSLCECPRQMSRPVRGQRRGV